MSRRSLIQHTLPPNSASSLKKQLYLTLVKSHLSYCSQLWRPRFLKDIQSIEQVQRKATKYILNDYTSDYTTRLLSLNLLPLMYRFELQDIMFLVKHLKYPSDNLDIPKLYHLSIQLLKWVVLKTNSKSILRGLLLQVTFISIEWFVSGTLFQLMSLIYLTHFS